MLCYSSLSGHGLIEPSGRVGDGLTNDAKLLAYRDELHRSTAVLVR